MDKPSKDKTIAIRLTDEQLQALAARADANERSLSQEIRKLIRESIERESEPTAA